MNWWDTIRIELALLAAVLCSQVLGQGGQDSSYYGGDYGGDYGAGYYQVSNDNNDQKDNNYPSNNNNNYDNYVYQPQAEEEPYITCFTCHYHVKGGVPEGMPQCDEPFDEMGVPTVKCYNNEPCGQNSNANKPKVNSGPKTILCYACHYHIQSGYAQGMATCDDPFDESSIPTVDCPGPCGKIRQTMTDDNPDDYLVTRNCIPKCKERSADEEGNFQECCTTSLCNGAGSEKTVSSSTLIFSSIVSIFLLLR